jgi:hypothetical protein
MSKVQLAGNASGTGIFTIASPNSNTDRTLTLPDATGTVQLSGNPISGTTGTFSGLIYANGGGVQFPATVVSSGDANCLDDYEEGTWTPTDQSGAGLSITINGSGYRNRYTKIGNLLYLTASIVYPSTSNTSSARLSLPFPQLITGFYSGGGYMTYSTRNPTNAYQISTENAVGGGGSQTFIFYDGTIWLSNADLSGQRLDFQIQYLVT